MMTVTYYINLDRVPARRAYIEAHFSSRGLSDVVRFSATDAKDPMALKDARFRPGLGDRWDMPRSAIACFESHRRVWQAIADRGAAAAAVFEDDVLLSKAAAGVIDRLIASPGDYDVVKIDYSPKTLRFGPERDLNGVAVRALLQTDLSAAGYVLSASGCRKLLDWSINYGDHLDDFIFTPRPDWRVFQAFPAVATQLMFKEQMPGHDPGKIVSKSERTSDPAINEKPNKGPVWFRLKKELIRAARKIYRRFFGDASLLWRGGYIGLIPLASDLQGDAPADPCPPL